MPVNPRLQPGDEWPSPYSLDSKDLEKYEALSK